MAYIGQRPVIGRYIKLDQISSGFNGSNTGFSMTAGSQAVFPGTARNLLLSLGGVIQEPDTDFTISGSTLTFTTPPVANTTFFGVIYGDMQSTGTPSDGTVLPASIASSGNFSFPQLTVTSSASLLGGAVFNENGADVDFRVEGDTDANLLFVDASAEKVGIGASSLQAKLHVESSTSYVDIALRNTTSGSSGTDGVDIFLNNNLELGLWNREAGPIRFATSSTERMRILSDGKVGIGTATPNNTFQVHQSGSGATVIQVTNADTGSGATDGFQFGVNSSEQAFFHMREAAPILFTINGSERMRIDSSGKLLLGTTTEGEGDADDLTVATSGHTGITIRSGTSNDGAIFFSDGTSGNAEFEGTIQYLHSVNAMTFKTNHAERIRIDSSGKVGIGTTTIGNKLQVHEASSNASFTGFSNDTTGSSSSDGLIVGIDSDENGVLYHYENKAIRFATNNSERMRLDSSGNLVLGSSTASGALTVVSTKNAESGRSNSQNYHLHLRNNENDNGEAIGISFGITSSSTGVGASILHERDSSGSQGSLQFYTNGDGSNVAERMRIDSSGVLSIGTTSPNASATNLHVENSGENNVYFVGNTSTSGARLILHNKNTTANSFTGVLGADAGGQTTADIKFYSADNATNEGYLTLETRPANGSPTERMRISSVGNVGINTNSPDKLLHVSDTNNTGVVTPFRLTNTGGSPGTEVRMEFECGVDEIAYIGGKNEGSDTGPLMFATASSQGAYPTEKMRLTKNGDLLIGTTSEVTDTTLVVDGNIAQRNSSTGSNQIVKKFVVSRAYTMSTTTVAAIKLDNWGTSAFEITAFRRDTASPHGAEVQKLYLGVQGSGSNMTDTALVTETKVTKGAIHNVTYTANDNGNFVTIDVTGDDNGGEAQTLIFYIIANGGSDGDCSVQ